MKNIKEFLKWLVFKNPISLVYYAFLITFFIVTFHQKQSIIDNNSEEVFKLIVAFLGVCLFLFTFLSVIPEYKKRND